MAPLAPPPQPQPADPYTEYATFLHPSFDPNSFAHSIVNNEPYPPPAPATTDAKQRPASPAPAAPPTTATGFMKGLGAGDQGGDVSAALARLNFGVEDLNRQLKQEITKHHSSLLLQAASLGGLGADLTEVREKLAQVEGGVSNLRKKITVPHASLSSSLTLLTRLRRASSLARRASRFTILARRLEGQMAEIDGELSVPNAGAGAGSSLTPTATGERERTRERRERAMAEAALTLAEIESLLTTSDGLEAAEDDPEALLSIRTINAVEANVPAVEHSRRRVVEEMESTVQRGLTELDNPLLASSLQTAHNLSVLPSLVDSLVASLTDLVSRKVKACFDMGTLAREVGGKDSATSAASAFVYKSRTRNEPTTATMPQWAAVLWARLESLIADMGSICIKVYTLEKVLKLKRDQNTQASFLDEAMSVLDDKPSLMFWTTLSQSFETQTKEAARSSAFIQTTLSTGYPRLLRLFHEFFSKIAVHTDTVYTQTQQSPETVLILRSIQPFETLYLTRSTNRLNEAVTSSFSISSSLSASFSSRPPTVPTANEGLSVSRAIVNELDAARFDPLLVKAIAKGASRAVELYVQKSEALIAQDHSATSLLGPLATPSQHSNADLASSLYHLWSPLNRALPEHSESVRTALRPCVDNTRTAYQTISNPLIMAIRRDFSSIIARMHRVDYSKNLDVNGAGAGGGGGGASSYMVDLTEKLTLVREEILGAYRVGDLAKEWALDLARFTVQTFILHASIVKQLGESGKLKLTSDTTSLEFAVSQYLSSHGLSLASMGDQFKALRAFRPLLFLEDSALSSLTQTTDVPALILLHHILSRSSLPLPHQVHGWSEAEYVRWLNEHGEKERIKVVEGVVRKSEEGRESGAEEEELVHVLKEVLERSKRGLGKDIE
ncbi:Golgi transport complex subunit 5-domain-containing protein [Leucosporidium creatinivorum]|uniref:Conserved oligomeric Golgi complex subunit 5 n=1 Tax=Leucosporidium creatinivorum TaxID=106004 RepID=A0A1Y2EQR6_9BASI|nr:Golgi transport complex subunit 5-domain-containing protein [Leucosporidium creatinivorum]